MTVLDRPSVDLDAPLKALPDSFAARVMAEDLDLGVPMDPESCAVSRAMRRQLVLDGCGRVGTDVRANLAEVHASGGRFALYRHDAETLIKRFDLGMPVVPCTVTFRRFAWSRDF